MLTITSPKLIPSRKKRTYSAGCGDENAMLPENAAIIMAKPINIVFLLPILFERKLAAGDDIIAAAWGGIKGIITSFSFKPRMYYVYVAEFDVSAL